MVTITIVVPMPKTLALPTVSNSSEGDHVVIAAEMDRVRRCYVIVISVVRPLIAPP